MGKASKTLKKVLLGRSDANIVFEDLCGLLCSLGFDERIKGSHHIFSKGDIPEVINIQPREKSKAKQYQVKQVRNLIIQYSLGTEDDED